MGHMNRICWLMFVASCLNAGSIYENLQYVSDPIPVWADFTVRGEQLLDFRSSDATGRFSIQIPGLPNGAILDGGFIDLYGGLFTLDGEASRGPVRVNGGWTLSAALDYHGASVDLAGPYSILDYTGAGTVEGNWEVTYGWPGTDATVFGNGPDGEIRKAGTVEFRVQADVAVDYHFRRPMFRAAPVPEPATVGFCLAGLGLVAAGRFFRR